MNNMGKPHLRLARPWASAIVVLSLTVAGCGQGETVSVAGGRETAKTAVGPARPSQGAARADALRKLEESPEVKKHGKLR
jgi:hypothetical protein